MPNADDKAPPAGFDQEALTHMLGLAEFRPLDINIETTNFCPLKCTFCPNVKFRRKKALMSPALFEKICDDFHSLGGGAVGLCSMQSDIFADDLLMQRVAVLEARKDRFRIHTTASLLGAKTLSDPDLVRLLAVLDFLVISLGGVDRQSYAAMMGVNGFDLFRAQLVRVHDLLARHRLDARVVVSIRTHDREMVADSDFLKFVTGLFPVDEVRNWFFSWGGLVTQADLPQGARLWAPDQTGRTLDCSVPWAELSVNVDGTVVGCGCVDWNARHVVGNLSTQTISEVWTSPAAVAFRTGFSAGKVPGLCRDCSLYTPVTKGFGRPSLRGYKPTDGLYYCC